MKKKFLSAVLLLIVLAPRSNGQELTQKLSELSYLMGKYTIEVFVPDGESGWNKGGSGAAEYTTILDGTFIQEKVKTITGQSTLTMWNTLGIEPRTGKPRLIAMDKEFGTMDVYEGELSGNILKLSNLHSDARFETQNGSLAFQLTLEKLSNDSHELLVEFTNDDGKTWKPYVKQRYIRRK